METAISWIVWGIISFWILKTFYFSFKKNKLERLRKTAFGINLLVIITGFLPLLTSITSQNGFELLSFAHIIAIIFSVGLFVSTGLLLSTQTLNLKIASAATIVNTLAFFGVMYGFRPGTFVLTIYDIVPIVAAFLLLINSVVVLLLWQQLYVKKRKI